MQVDIAKDLGDASKPRAWSKYSQDSSAYKKWLAEKEKDENLSKETACQKKTNNVEEALADVSV